MAEITFNNNTVSQCNPDGVPGTLHVNHPQAKNRQNVEYDPNFIPVASWCWAAFCKAVSKPLWVVSFVDTTETKVLAWIWSWLGPRHAQIVDVSDSASDFIHIQQRNYFEPPVHTRTIHIDSGLPAATHAWYIIYVKDFQVPKPVSSFELESVVSIASKIMDWAPHDPIHNMFWTSISPEVIHRWQVAQKRATTSEESAKVLGFIQQECTLGGQHMCPLEEVHKHFLQFYNDEDIPWCVGLSSAQFFRHPSILEALRICGATVSTCYQNRVWPRGSRVRRHTTYVRGVDLKMIYA
jgi:hypothetical protein